MPVRTTVDIPEALHQVLRERARRSNVSIRSLIVRAVDQAYREKKKGRYVTGPLVTGPFKRGPRFPKDKNPHDLVFS